LFVVKLRSQNYVINKATEHFLNCWSASIANGGHYQNFALPAAFEQEELQGCNDDGAESNAVGVA